MLVLQNIIRNNSAIVEKNKYFPIHLKNMNREDNFKILGPYLFRNSC